MKKLLAFIPLLLLLTSCSPDNKEQAIAELLQDNKHAFSIHVFSDKSFEEAFKKSIQENMNRINNQNLAGSPITNISFVDVTDNNKYDYEKLLDLKVYPQILLFKHETIVLKTTDPNELYSYFINQANP